MQAKIASKAVGSRLIGMTGFKLGAERRSKTNVRNYSESYGREPLANSILRTRGNRSSIGSMQTDN